MIILPERGTPRGKFLLPQRPLEWRQPSQRRSTFGIENVTRFNVAARLHDGAVVWRGWFDDREDFDAFLYALSCGSLIYERELWKLPNPYWPGLGTDVLYDFNTNRVITSLSGANQTDVVPLDWNNGNNSIEVIASGGSGSANGITNDGAGGGGGGAYSKAVNVSLGATADFFLNDGGSFRNASAGTNLNGFAGSDAWYNGATFGTASVAAVGGNGGNAIGAAGGDAASGTGSTKTSGGNGGTGASSSASGGGGAGGPNGDGVSSSNASGGTNTAGGSGDAGSGGAGGAVGGGNGGDGTEFDGLRGSGGGGGGADTPGGDGGLYGAGGGGAQRDALGATSGNGAQGVIFITYAALMTFSHTPDFNLFFMKKPMVGY